MEDVILASIMGPPRYIRGTHGVDNIETATWWNMSSPSQYVGYVCYRIKHLTGESFLAILIGGEGPWDTPHPGQSQIILSRDSGHNWTLTYHNNSLTMSSLEVGAGYAYVGTGEGILRSNDGENWALLSGSPTNIRNMVIFPDGKIMVTKGDKVYRSLDSGSTWQEVYSPFRGSPYTWLDNEGNPGKASYAIAGKSSNYVVASMGAALWLTVDFGDSWAKIIEWDSRHSPTGLLFTRGSTFILKLRSLSSSGTEELTEVMVSSDNCHTFVHKFNQEAEWDHQIEYLAPANLILVAHVHPVYQYTWTPSILYSEDDGLTFIEKLIYPETVGHCSNYGLMAVAGWILEPQRGIYSMDILIKEKFNKNYHMGMRLASKPRKNYTMNIRNKRVGILKTYSMDAVLKKLAITHSYRNSIRIRKLIGKSYIMDLQIMQRIGKTYAMDMFLTRRGHMVYLMSCLKRKTVTTTYGMGICLVKDYRGPLKRDVMLAFPQPFALEIQNVNYVLNQDITVQRTDENGY
jgi:hypothetical protein